MKAYGGVDVFLTSALVGGEWSASRSGLFTASRKVTLTLNSPYVEQFD
jgi:hypothetical protein